MTFQIGEANPLINYKPFNLVENSGVCSIDLLMTEYATRTHYSKGRTLHFHRTNLHC